MSNLNLTLPVKEFVSELNGRYKAYVSDEFLIALLEYELKRAVVIPVNPAVRKADNFLPNLAYDIGALVFEAMLESRCKAGGDGHHVAQEFAKKFELAI